MSAPVVVVGEQGVQGTLTPEAIAGAAQLPAPTRPGWSPRSTSRRRPRRSTRSWPRPRRRAGTPTLDFSTGRPVVIPSKDGRGVDYQATLARTCSPCSPAPGERTITAIYADQPAELTTDELNKLGITGVIGEFTTRGFAPDSGRNIRRAAQVINGMIVKPGETFSLNGATEPRNAANGYVEAGIISDGHASRGVGGGVSQVATTLYNASYFAGMVDVEHKEHSFYISRYPPGREATVFDDAIDMKFRNDNPTGVHDPDGLDPGVDHGAAVRDQALRGDLDARAADQPDRAAEGLHPGRRAVRRRATAHPASPSPTPAPCGRSAPARCARRPGP